MTPLHGEQPGDRVVECSVRSRVEHVTLVAVLCSRIHAEVHAAAERCGALHNGHELIEIVVLDHRVEADVVDAAGAHSVHSVKDLLGEAGYSTRGVMPAIEVVE